MMHENRLTKNFKINNILRVSKFSGIKYNTVVSKKAEVYGCEGAHTNN